MRRGSLHCVSVSAGWWKVLRPVSRVPAEEKADGLVSVRGHQRRIFCGRFCRTSRRQRAFFLLFQCRHQDRLGLVMPATQSNRGTAGVYELQLRRKLLQQQLGVVDEKCQRVAKVVAKKHLARLSRQEKSGQPAVPGRDVADRRRKTITNPGGLPSIGVVGVGGDVGLAGVQPAATSKVSFQGRDRSQNKQDLLAAAPFKKGGCIDHNRKKQILQEKQREIERQATLEKKMRPGRKGLGVRDEVPVAPSAFPDRYLRGEVPCSKHCSAGESIKYSYTACVL